MNRKEILDTAKQFVAEDRNTEYGEPEDSFAFIGELWSTYLKRRRTPSPRTDTDAYDVALMMGLMKVARAAMRPKNADSLVDLAGYAACAGETLDKTRVPQVPVRHHEPSVTSHSHTTSFPRFDPGPGPEPAPSPAAMPPSHDFPQLQPASMPPSHD